MSALIGVLLLLLNIWGNAASAQNLFYNGGFEGGVDHRFAVERWYISGPAAVTLDMTTKTEGLVSAKIPFSRLANSTAPVTIDGIGFRSAVPVAAAKRKQYELSVWVRSEDRRDGRLYITTAGIGDDTAKVLAERHFSVGREWSRLRLPFQAAASTGVYWGINVRSSSPGHLWLDDVVIAAAGARDEAAAVAGIAVDRPGHLFFSGATPYVNLRAYNGGNAMAALSYTVRVFAVDGAEVASVPVVLNIQPQSGLVEKVELPVSDFGLYRVTLEQGAGGDALSEVHLAYLRPARSVPPQFARFGAYATIAPESLTVLSGLGFRWIATLTSNARLNYWSLVEKEQGKFLWYDADVELAKAHGFEMMFTLEPCQTPTWARQYSREKRRELWGRYVGRMVEHYRGSVKHWTIGDEIWDVREKSYKRDCWTDMKEYAQWHKVGYEAVKRADPSAQVILNSLDQSFREVFDHMPASYADILGVNAYHLPRLLAPVRDFAARKGIDELWAPGIAVHNFPFYANAVPAWQKEPLATDYWYDKNTELVRAVAETLGMGVSKIFHYTASYVGNTNIYSLFEHDGSPKPLAVQFAALAWLLDGTRTASNLPSIGADVATAWRFDRADDRSIVVLLFKDAEPRGARLPVSWNRDWICFDRMTNPYPVANGQGSRISGIRDGFIACQSRRGQADDLVSALRGARFAMN